MASMQDIDHIILVIMENRSFDHYLGALTREEGRTDVDGLPMGGGVSNPSGEGEDIGLIRLDDPANPIEVDNKIYRDPPHEAEQVAMQINAGRMNGFVRAYEKQYRKQKKDPPKRAQHVMGYLTRSSLPVLYRLADEFAVCDRWFSSFAGSTWPNRVYLLAGDCDELVGTGAKWLPRWNAYRYPDPPFVRDWHQMENRWKAYSANPEQDSTFGLWRVGPVYRGGKGGSLDDFASDCQHGTLPRLAIVEPDYSLSDDHPPHQPMRGQQFIARVVKALLSSESTWQRSLLVLTYDEHGGFYDHVAPPGSPEGRPKPHHTLGVRVPTMVISPYTRKGSVAHELFDHTSFLKTVAERWGYSAPGPRASSAAITSLWHSSCFDWNQAPRNGMTILREITEPGYTLDSDDIMPAVLGEPTQLESDLRALNLLRRMERLL